MGKQLQNSQPDWYGKIVFGPFCLSGYQDL
jgi:hypothetical protein